MGIKMTLRTGYVCVLTFELEGISIVIEVIKTIDPVVTGKAIGAK